MAELRRLGLLDRAEFGLQELVLLFKGKASKLGLAWAWTSKLWKDKPGGKQQQKRLIRTH
jgi:hypothetical protein